MQQPAAREKPAAALHSYIYIIINACVHEHLYYTVMYIYYTL